MGIYDVTYKWTGNSVTITPKKMKPEGQSVSFGLGDAVITFNLSNPPEETIIKEITGETKSSSLYPNNPYGTKKWKQIALEVQDETVNLAMTADGAIKPLNYKSANFRKFEVAGSEVVPAGYLAYDWGSLRRMSW